MRLKISLPLALFSLLVALSPAFAQAPAASAGTGKVPTTENIAIAIWERLEGKIPHARLHRVRVYEMADLFADYYGER